MKEVKEPEQKPSPPKKPLIFYYCLALIALMLLNALFFPSVLERQVYEVPYSQFLTMNSIFLASDHLARRNETRFYPRPLWNRKTQKFANFAGRFTISYF